MGMETMVTPEFFAGIKIKKTTQTQPSRNLFFPHGHNADASYLPENL